MGRFLVVYLLLLSVKYNKSLTVALSHVIGYCFVNIFYSLAYIKSICTIGNENTVASKKIRMLVLK